MEDVETRETNLMSTGEPEFFILCSLLRLRARPKCAFTFSNMPYDIQSKSLMFNLKSTEKIQNKESYFNFRKCSTLSGEHR